ncbi:hypothetical protein [Pseudomonas syringae]|uniref:hypothetical protein n=1 Tax=Pseudomonas syringae TaxID=317 RepID=UPI00101273AA|nr:hypothetical protein [Pseudomonas syringae]
MDEIDWGSRVPAYVGLVLSLLALWRGRTSVKVSLGIRDKDEEIWVTNMSPHEVEIVSLGAVKADGSLSDWFDGPDPWPGLPKRVPARSQVVIKLHPAQTPSSLYRQYNIGKGGCFVRVAGGRTFSNPPRFKRVWWRMVNWFRAKSPHPDL